MTLPTIYFDEAGNTGQELFNADQPWFVLAALNIEADRARELIASVRVKNYAEIKFTSLKKSRDGREALMTLYDGLDPESVKAVAYHKRFMITTEIVDLLVETLAHATGMGYLSARCEHRFVECSAHGAAILLWARVV